VSRPLWFVGADGSVVSRALGVLRLSLLALAIGQGLVANAFATASLLPYLISLVVTGGILGSTLLPQLLPQFVTSDREDPAGDADKTATRQDRRRPGRACRRSRLDRPGTRR
jgi:putative peptidoglycan lipid II flippase